MTDSGLYRFPNLTRWPFVRDYARGVFWGTALGQNLCARLGGQERVLREVPSFYNRTLGDGLWLQVSRDIPPTRVEIDHFAEYLKPILDWSGERSTIMSRQRIDMAPRKGILPWWESAAPSKDDLSYQDINKERADSLIPIRRVQISDEEVTINIHLGDLPTTEQRRAIGAAIQRWYKSVESNFGRLFSDIGSIAVNGRIIRWSAKGSGVDVEEALLILRDEFASLANMRVTEIVVGIEAVG